MQPGRGAIANMICGSRFNYRSTAIRVSRSPCACLNLLRSSTSSYFSSTVLARFVCGTADLSVCHEPRPDYRLYIGLDAWAMMDEYTSRLSQHTCVSDRWRFSDQRSARSAATSVVERDGASDDSESSVCRGLLSRHRSAEPRRLLRKKYWHMQGILRHWQSAALSRCVLAIYSNGLHVHGCKYKIVT